MSDLSSFLIVKVLVQISAGFLKAAAATENTERIPPQFRESINFCILKNTVYDIKLLLC